MNLLYDIKIYNNDYKSQINNLGGIIGKGVYGQVFSVENDKVCKCYVSDEPYCDVPYHDDLLFLEYLTKQEHVPFSLLSRLVDQIQEYNIITDENETLIKKYINKLVLPLFYEKKDLEKKIIGNSFANLIKSGTSELISIYGKDNALYVIHTLNIIPNDLLQFKCDPYKRISFLRDVTIYKRLVEVTKDTQMSRHVCQMERAFMAKSKDKYYGFVIMKRYNTDLSRWLHGIIKSSVSDYSKMVFKSILFQMSVIISWLCNNYGFAHRDLKPANIFLSKEKCGIITLDEIEYDLSRYPTVVIGDYSLCAISDPNYLSSLSFGYKPIPGYDLRNFAALTMYTFKVKNMHLFGQDVKLLLQEWLYPIKMEQDLINKLVVDETIYSSEMDNYVDNRLLSDFKLINPWKHDIFDIFIKK